MAISLAALKKDNEMQKTNESLKDTILTGLRADLNAFTVLSKSETARADKLAEQLAPLTKRLEANEKLLTKMNQAAIKARSLVLEQPEGQKNSDGLSGYLVFAVVLLAGIASASFLIAPEQIATLSNIVKEAFF